MKSQTFKSSGTLDYNDTDFKPGWLIVKVDTGLAEYYLHSMLLGRSNFPARGPHITVTCGEKESTSFNFQVLHVYHGKIVDFTYGTAIGTNGRAFWLDCNSVALDKIRKDLGLPPRKFHLSIGNIKNK